MRDRGRAPRQTETEREKEGGGVGEKGEMWGGGSREGMGRERGDSRIFIQEHTPPPGLEMENQNTFYSTNLTYNVDLGIECY